MTPSDASIVIHLTPRLLRLHESSNESTSFSSTTGEPAFLPTGTSQLSSPRDLLTLATLPRSISTPSTPNARSSVLSSALPVSNTITDPAPTFSTLSRSTLIYPRAATAVADPQIFQAIALVNPVCIGDGIDASSLGLISTLVLPSVIGIIVWLIFAIIRPRYRQIYGLREWFVQPSLRPKPLRRSFWAFLTPYVPLVPSISMDISDTGKSVAKAAELYPSDEQLSQRTLWTCFLIVSGWTILGLAGFLPLYMSSTPCLARSAPPSQFTGAYSTLQDLSLLRLLQLLDDRVVTTVDETVNGQDATPNTRIRIIIITVFAIALGVLPALWIIINEFNKLVAYRKRWVYMCCQGQEMGWLNARRASGFVGWGEKRFKDYLVKTGLSSTVDSAEGRNGHSRRGRRNQDSTAQEKGDLEVDVQALFSIGDTTQVALLIDERDEILENLEVAETKYIQSFRLSTPDPSIADWHPPLPPVAEEPDSPPKPEISRPRPLGGSMNRRRRRRGRNPAYGSSSLPPTSYVMPSHFYRISDMEGITGGEFTGPQPDLLSRTPPRTRTREASLSDSFNKRVVGSRFQEVNRNSAAYGRIPMGSQLMVDNAGELSPMSTTDSPIPNPGLYGPNQHSSWDTAAFADQPHQWFPPQTSEPILEEPEEWVDVLEEDPEAFEHTEEYPRDKRRRPRPPRRRTRGSSSEERESFPLRNRSGVATAEELPPPHLRLQPRQPFVRPLSGLDHDALSVIYADINHWRWKLKVINTEIAEVQRECYDDIADGARIKGWLMIGRGLSFVPDIQLIEGRAKEDIRWDELQNGGDGGFMRTFALWTIVITIGIMLGIGLTAVSGLVVAGAPDVAHYFPFLVPLAHGNDLGTGIATTLVPAVVATLFISLAMRIINYAGQLSHPVSLSGYHMLMFKMMFYALTVAGAIWLFTVGAILFSMRALSVRLGETESIANGVIYMSTFAMALVLNVAIIFPAVLLLQPVRLWKVLQAEREAMTPRQRFRAVYPRTYNPSYATGCCVLAFLFASAFSLIFPLVAPTVLLLLFLTLIAHRFLVGYVYGRTHSQTGGLLQIWLLRRLGTLLAFQPLLLGLILLSRLLWIEGGVLCGVALFVALFVEIYCSLKMRQPGRISLSPITLDSLDTFARTAHPGKEREVDEESTSLVSSARNTRARGSFASVLEMMSLTLAVTPSPSETRGPVPLSTETLDDLTATERAARTNPDAPPHLPPLSFADHAEEMAGVLYAPELLAPPPVIWLPNDVGGIGRSEAFDLQRYHNLHVTLDVRAKEDVSPGRSTSSQNHQP